MPTPKFLGLDCELSTSGTDRNGKALQPLDVTRAILAHIDAAFEPHGTRSWSKRSGWSATSASYSNDCFRHWTPNGQCFYMDMTHLEVCGAVVLSARDYAAQCYAALTIAEEARARAEEASGGDSYILTAANTDTFDPAVSWGSHFNVCVDAALWEDLFDTPRRPAVLGFVSSFMAAVVALLGAGYLLPCDDGLLYSTSGRAHHLTRIATYATTEAYGRGLLNSRRERHGKGHERMHLISTDFALIAAALKAVVVQCALAAAEDGFCGLNLYDPVKAMRQWSWGFDPETCTMPATASLTDGSRLTLPEYVRELCRELLARVEDGRIDDSIAPGAGDLLALVVELTHKLEEGGSSFAFCARHLDWAAKWMFLEKFREARGIGPEDPELRLADHDFTRTNHRGGALWRLWEGGLVDPLVDRSRVEAFLADAPHDTRAWARGQLISRFGPELTDVDWSRLELRLAEGRWAPRLRIRLQRMTSLTRARFEPLLERVGSVADLGIALSGARGVEVETLDGYFGFGTGVN